MNYILSTFEHIKDFCHNKITDDTLSIINSLTLKVSSSKQYSIQHKCVLKKMKKTNKAKQINETTEDK